MAVGPRVPLGLCVSLWPWALLLWCTSSAFAFTLRPAPRLSYRGEDCKLRMQQRSEVLEAISTSVREATGEAFDATFGSGGMGGGGGAAVGTVKDSRTGKEYFYKMSGMAGFDMLRAEYLGIKEIYDTNSIRVPQPICYGTGGPNSYAIFEKLSIGGNGGRAGAEEMGKRLALLHKKTSYNNMYGWDIDNTIGATYQPNKWTSSWVDFWDEYRLGHMLSLCKREGAAFPREKELRGKVRQILSSHHCVPSLVHGDLWSGNAGYLMDGIPVIYDPATYYGDREVDIAMTYLFGRFPTAFHEAYAQVWPLEEGHEQRREVYNLYHILNHFVLFGGSYLSQANGMIANILRM